MTFQQKFIRCSQGILIIAGCILLFAPSEYFPVFYRPRLMGLVAFLYAFGIQLPEILFRVPARKSAESVGQQRVARRHLQMGLSVGFLLGGLGSLGFWTVGEHVVGFEYDKFVHLVFATLAMAFGVRELRAWHGWSTLKTVIVVGFIGVAMSVGWEYLEYASDRWLHFGYFGRLFDTDSLGDIVADLVGIGVGAVATWWL